VSQETEITRRTKQAIRAWANLPAEMGLTLDDELGDLRPNYLNELRAALNQEFGNEHGMPIASDAADWNEEKLKTVENVRDIVQKRLNAT